MRSPMRSPSTRSPSLRSRDILQEKSGWSQNSSRRANSKGSPKLRKEAKSEKLPAKLTK